jgi:hypothetical protein
MRARNGDELASEDSERVALQVAANNTQVLTEIQSLQDREREFPLEMSLPPSLKPGLQGEKKEREH